MLRWRRSAHPLALQLGTPPGAVPTTRFCRNIFLRKVSLPSVWHEYTGSFTSDNEPDGIENATHNTFSKKAGYFNFNSRLFSGNVVWVAFQFRRAHNHSRITLYTPFWFFHRRVLLPSTSPGKSPLCFLFSRKVSLHSSWHITRGIPLPTFVVFFFHRKVSSRFMSPKEK
jgi:hypothetical protein